ncbi:TIGR00255 family protein [Sulfurivirga caldicuralii]|uniref:TIGR00255 family protein n=1 Tax=Sulfurivirga caldicuralii TaxID=364032 RepID=A0A1N6DGL6_9GAMM|nr:YicC/YloC family endoribonuclease [Sulfurivirga caldicuralii]SIN69804.1 TIGR00255 family protein [Sulfurivirga caldicuralii]
MKSMTAFARTQCSYDWGLATWEIKSVNHRYLELHFRLPEGWRELEMALRERAKHQLARGKVEFALTLTLDAHLQRPSLNDDVLNGLIEVIRDVRLRLPAASHLNAVEILKWPGVIAEPQLNREQMLADLTACAEQALQQLNAAREREGAALKALIEQRLNAMEKLIEPLTDVVPEAVKSYETRLRERIAQLQADVDEQRLAQEVALMAQKLDVAEELDRLRTNIKLVREALQEEGPIGRRLDFLMQELNREANTLGSKASDMRLTEAAVELKVLIEQMREQVQNIE